MNENIFTECHTINGYLINNKIDKARNSLIKLLDYHNIHNISYTPLVNHLIRQTGLFQYLDINTCDWQERFIYNAFKVDVGSEEPVTLHREQSFLLKELLQGKNVAVSAPTSFGKSFVIDAYIKLKKPNNVVIIVPTLALTDETRRRLYKKFSKEYKIITTSDVQLADKNIFIFPQERALNYIDVLQEVDILIIDEFYKAGYKFDKHRAPMLIQAILKLGEKAKQKYYLAPNIQSIEKNPFTNGMVFHKLDFNTVFLEKHPLYRIIKKDKKQKEEFLLRIINQKITKTLIYAGTYSNIKEIAIILLKNRKNINSELLVNFSKWLEKNYLPNWILTKLVEKGIGVHNGQLHRSLSQIQVRLFEEQKGLNNIISTSSIIEGVNTSAENVILWSNKNGNSKFNDFTYKNIIGRGGRMFKHFIGKIYILEAPPQEEQTQLQLPLPDEIIGSVDKNKYGDILTDEQYDKLQSYDDEMEQLLGVEIYQELKKESQFHSSDMELVKLIARDLKENSSKWNELNHLNNANPENWTNLLYNIIKFQPGKWDVKYNVFVKFIKVMRYNWYKSIPELFNELKDENISLGLFFKLERNLTFKFSTLLKDLDLLQKIILKDKKFEFGSFIRGCSQAFLPKVVFQLEEYGLPRMISKKIHHSKIINLENKELTIHSVIEEFNKIGLENLIKQVDNLDEFDKYILEYFYDGIKTGL